MFSYSCRVLVVVIVFGVGGGRIFKVFGNGSMAVFGIGSVVEIRGEGFR